ncbi:hypothetical protein CspeluHIS016_0205950 [Cutaneotrichosporon spelunceum]|uniref:Sensitive to high expression protein 9, mitochondrial n=1 Tax=Cutaneotrichosporon spelunceum TaxID=1672016 RepID=A0AAD3YB95_9TREE|nr:hypothetical protein CspeluHIS016_0205950 [Cutaneotrichosporon spelunceum]
MALLRPRLGLGLSSRASVAPPSCALSVPARGIRTGSSPALARGIRTGSPPRRASDPDEDQGPVIALDGPPPSPPLPRYDAPRYDAFRHDAPRHETSHHSAPHYDTASHPPYSASYEHVQLERDSEVTAPTDVRVKVEGAPRDEDSSGKPIEAPILLSADAPPEPVPRIAPPSPSPCDGREPPKPSDSTKSSAASDATASKEEWERKYEELQAAYSRKMGEVRAKVEERKKKLAVQTGQTLSMVGKKVNEVTGYREVERLKQSVKDRESEIREGRATVREAKKAYEDAVATLSTTQQSVNALLERKHSWSDQDVATFTKLVRSDHASRAAVTNTSDALKNAEMSVDKAFTALMQSILERYHEEQVWSDKIRSVSTWAQVAALVANLIVFMSAIAFIEPWKRRRLVQGLEERVSGMMTSVEDEIHSLTDKIGELDNKISAAAVTAATTMPAVVADVRAGGEAVGEGEAALAHESAAQADAVADLVNSLLADALDLDSDSDSAETESDISHYPARAINWTMDQLGHIAPPSRERDLAAAGVLGAVAGAVVIGMCSLAASLFKS